MIYLDYCHQILYKSNVGLPFRRFATFRKSCQKFSYQNFTCFMCALTIFCVKRSTFSIVFVDVSSLGRTKLIFIDPVVKINGSYYQNTLLRQYVLPAIRSISGRLRFGGC